MNFQQNISIQKTIITSANTERIVTLPATRVFSLRVTPDVASSVVRMAFSTGVVSNGGGAWWTVRTTKPYTHDDLYLSGAKLYFAIATGQATRTIRVMSIT